MNKSIYLIGYYRKKAKDNKNRKHSSNMRQADSSIAQNEVRKTFILSLEQSPFSITTLHIDAKTDFYTNSSRTK